MQPYRGASGGSSTLAALAAEAGAAVPRQSTLLTAEQLTERRELAAGVQGQRAGGGYGMLAAVSGMAVTGTCSAALKHDSGMPDGFKVFLGASLVATVVFVALAISQSDRAKRKRDEAVAQMLAWPSTLPFPVDGYEEFLVADGPLLEVVLAVEPERRMFVDAARAIDAAIEVEPITDRRFRLSLPPRSQTFTSKHSARLVRFGDRALVEQLFKRMILPLHSESGVEAVHFGGTIEERN